MQNLDLIVTLAGGFLTAVALGYVTQRLGLSPIVGYLLAGIAIGPQTPGFVADRHLAEQLAEVGVILLMFGVGLHFHLDDLMAVRRIAVLGALVQSSTATLLGAFVFHAFGWTWTQGVLFGLSLSVASTVVLVRVLSDNGELYSPTGRIAIGWLVMEDIFTVFALVLLPVVVGAQNGQVGQLGPALGIAALKLAAFIAFTLVVGGRLIPLFLTKVAETRSRELFTLSVLAIALGIAVGAAHFFDVSMALGAFLAGMVVGRSEFSARAGSEALPMRDAFAVMFFLSVGMLFDPRQALESPWIVGATLMIVIIGKATAAILIVAVLGYSSRIGLGVAVALAQIGEFSFLLASLGLQLGALPEGAMNPIVAAAILSIMINPLIYRLVMPAERMFQRAPRLWRLLNRRAALESGVPVASQTEADAAHRAVVVGYGPTGRILCRILKRHGIEPTVIEMNIDTHRALRQQGTETVYGDANSREVLEKAGVGRADSLILTASGSSSATEAVRAARELNPGIHIAARAGLVAEAAALRRAGATEVYSGEGEVALALASGLLRKLGATPDQLDEAQERIRREIEAG